MNWLSEEEKLQIAALASVDPEEESCGFVLNSGKVTRVPNMAKDRTTQFSIDPLAYAKAEETGLKGIWHSHLVLDGFSPLDQQVLAQDTVPWAVYCLGSGKFHQVQPGVEAPLLGRPFCYGVYDCYSLVSDKLQRLGVTLPPWPRREWGEWNKPGFTPFDDEAFNVGKPVTNGIYQEGDIILMNLGDHAGHTDHVGVFVDHQRFLHHPGERESRLDRYGSWWERKTRMVIRPAPLWRTSRRSNCLV